MKPTSSELKRAFIEGAKWWSTYTKVTTWDMVKLVEREADRRYGLEANESGE